MGKIIEIKTWPEYFQDVLDGVKSFELRYDDRDYQVGDILCLKEYDHLLKTFTGRSLHRQIIYKLSNEQFEGLSKNYCVLGLSVLPKGFILQLLETKSRTND